MQQNGKTKASSVQLRAKTSTKGRINLRKKTFRKKQQLKHIKIKIHSTVKTNKIKPEKLHIVSRARPDQNKGNQEQDSEHN
jgi:hypothetical protein